LIEHKQGREDRSEISTAITREVGGLSWFAVNFTISRSTRRLRKRLRLPKVVTADCLKLPKTAY
jgi:hypothetical protein